MSRNEELEAAQRTILLLKAEVERLSTPPYLGATVVNLGQKTTRISIDGSGFYEVALNEDLKSKLERGKRVIVNQSRAIIGDSEFSDILGETSVVDEIINGRIRVKTKGENIVVHSLVEGVKAGDEVILDPSRSLALEVLERKKTKYNLEQVPEAPWTIIGGLENTIREIREEIEDPFLHKAVFERYGRKPIKGALLYGPPGCGKTLIAKSIAYNLSKLNGQAHGQIISIKGPELLDKWVGSTELGIRQIYESARQNAEETKGLTVIFIDEAESLLKVRGSGISSDVYDTIVPQFLAEMDGLNGSENVITLLATNREDIIDPAILRNGRVDRKIKISRPNKEGAKEIFGIYLNGKPIEGSFLSKPSTEKLIDGVVDRLYSDSRILYEVHSTGEKVGCFYARNLVSGAMIKGIVDRACGYAINDEIKGKRKGISALDLERAVDAELDEASRIPQALVKSDWEEVFGHNGRTLYEQQGRGYVSLVNSNSIKLQVGGQK